MDSAKGENSNYQTSGLNVEAKEGTSGAISSIEEGETRKSDASNQEPAIDWKLLPPLPTPNQAKHKEYRCGASVLGGGAALCFVAVQSAYWSVDTEENIIVSTILVAVVSFLFLTEMICLLAIYHKDPGVVMRSESTCYPIPAQVQPYILSYIENQQQQLQSQSDGNTNAQGEGTIPMPSELYITRDADENSDNGDEASDTYCVRCLVWRRERKKYYHCNTCQRCVSHYDHHCNVFGRCIAGHLPFQGNLLLFYTAIGASSSLYAITALGLAWTLMVSGFLH